jgi:hypothetical protein
MTSCFKACETSSSQACIIKQSWSAWTIDKNILYLFIRWSCYVQHYFYVFIPLFLDTGNWRLVSLSLRFCLMIFIVLSLSFLSCFLFQAIWSFPFPCTLLWVSESLENGVSVYIYIYILIYTHAFGIRNWSVDRRIFYFFIFFF